MEKKYDIMYVVADLRRVGPSNQTLNIIKNSPIKERCLVITLFSEIKDTMIKEYQDENIDIVSLNLNRRLFFIDGPNKIRKLINKYHIKIVHSYGVKPDNICQKAVKKTNVKHVITLRNYPKEDILTRMNWLNAKLALHSHLKVLNAAKYVVACSKTIEQKMKLDYPKMNIVSIQNGVDIEKYTKTNQNIRDELRKKYDINTDDVVFVSTSSFIPRKRINETIEGFRKLNKLNFKLLLLGDGIEYDKIKEKFKDEKNISFIGKSNKVVEYLQLANAFVSSSESEGLPNGVIEAIACGIPVVLSNIPQHIEILNSIENAGIVYDLGDENDLSSKLLEIITYDNNNSNIVKSNLNMKKMSHNYYNYYTKILENEE